MAISEGNTYLIEQLVGYGADLNIKEQSGCTPLNVLVLLEISGVHATVTFHPISNKTPRLLQVLNLKSRIHYQACTCTTIGNNFEVQCLLLQYLRITEVYYSQLIIVAKYSIVRNLIKQHS